MYTLETLQGAFGMRSVLTVVVSRALSHHLHLASDETHVPKVLSTVSCHLLYGSFTEAYIHEVDKCKGIFFVGSLHATGFSVRIKTKRESH